MDSHTPSFGFFDPEMLATLEETFKAAWPLLEAQEPCLASEQQAELRLGLSQTFVALVADGVTDADQLQKLALARLPLWLGTREGGHHGLSDNQKV